MYKTTRHFRILAVCMALMASVSAWPRGKITVRTMLNDAGTRYTESVTHHDGLGRPVQTVQTGLNTSGKQVVTVSELNPDGTASREWLPFAASGITGPVVKSNVATLSSSSLSDSYAYSDKTYDALGRLIRSSTPGAAWRTSSKGVSVSHSANASNSVKMYQADVSGSGITDKGYWPACALASEKTTDEDGHTVEVFTDVMGRTVLERRGGDHDTYYVYNGAGQLRFILQPMYAENPDAGLYAFEYRYDQFGNVTYKAVPGGGYTEYWYDRAQRMAFMQDANLRAKGLHRFFVYDKFGRQAVQGVCASCTKTLAVNTASYTGGTTGFMQTGWTLASPANVQQATLEAVSYYETYSFVTSLDSRLSQATSVSAKGKQSGSVVYNSSGDCCKSAFYYDVKGNVSVLKEITDFGTLRVTENTYTFTGQPLTTKVTETPGVTTLTENVYDSATGLLTATDVTVNGVKQRVSAVAYDDLGRIASVTRGAAQLSGGTVSYTYNLHGQTKTITGPGFTQELFYTDGPGTKLYNGSVSSMKWKMLPDATVRGYKYSYNAYGWLTSAEYGEGDALSANKDRYTEKSNAFTRNGGITKLQRYGLTAGGTYGKIDDLTVSYSGNRINGVSDAAPAVTQNGSMDFPGGTTSKLFGYNSFGALASDAGRGITSITYDNFGNPLKVSFSNGGYTENVYSATGERLKTTHAVPVQGSVMARTTFHYRGDAVYRDGSVEMVRFPGGYATTSGGVKFHYYTQDYLGNNRAVISGSDGSVEQRVAYYPYGGVIATLGTPTTGQPFKFGGKELLVANGLNEYDFGARQYYSAVPGFTRIDPMAEKYPWLSPYLYCANNPVNLVDPTGKDSWTLDEMGNVMSYIATDKYDEIIVINRKNEDVNVWKGKYGSIVQKSNKESNDGSILTFSIDNDETGLNLFEFLADNSSVEWSVLQLGLSDESIENVVTTSHGKHSEAGATAFIVDNIFEIDIRNAIHSHPSGIEYPSGLNWDPKRPGDVQFAAWVDKINKNTQATYKIYSPLNKKYIEYNKESTNFDFLRK